MKKFIAPLLIFLIVLGTHFLSKVAYITDSRWVLHTSWALIHQRDTKMDVFQSAIERNLYYAIEYIDGHPHYTFPVGTPLLCAPPLWMMEQVAKRIYYYDIRALLENNSQGGMELFLAALFIALATVFVYLILREWNVQDRVVGASVLVFAFGTSAWSVGSRGLFAHGPFMLFVSIAVWSLIKAEKNKAWLWLGGLVCAFSYVIRPTGILPLMVFGVFVLWKYRKGSYRFIIPAVVTLVLFFARNYVVYHHLQSPYYSPSHIGQENHLLQGLAGTLFSPGRGLIIFSPVFLLLIPAVIYLLRTRTCNWLHIFILVLIIFHTLLISYFDNWYAGWCFGPRYFADIIPLLIILLALGLNQILETGSKIFKTTTLISFFILASISCWIHYRGANRSQTFDWNYQPINIDEARERVWDWRDLQFLR